MAAPVSKVRARPGTTIGTYSTGVFPEWMQQRQDFRRVFVLDDKIALALRKGDGNRSEDDLNRLTHWLFPLGFFLLPSPFVVVLRIRWIKIMRKL